MKKFRAQVITYVEVDAEDWEKALENVQDTLDQVGSGILRQIPGGTGNYHVSFVDEVEWIDRLKQNHG